ncbi:MAG: monovalent cation:proton antiporter-2 (CPA2) family protein [Deltaproteobacteria bacterium]|nr:monovalent cation:proton antiporter-2 (CPA2) family protein [Deltaproteobacteria bacterium]
MTDSVLSQAFVYLAAAVIGVPIARKLGLGSVLGYLLAGVVIGPWVLGLVGHEGHHVMHFAEFGVVMMLFLVGLELRPSLLWELRRPILGLGGLQVVVTTAAATAGAIALGVAWQPALAVGMILAMSSTAIVLATLSEKGLLQSRGGQASFSVLLFQDIAVIPILAVFPLLGTAAATDGDGRPGWLQALILLGAVGGVVLVGTFLVRPMFRILAEIKVRESFTAAALLLVIGIALLMQAAGLSPALGTFLAGVILAESEYRHELEGDIEPFKGLLLGLFFISVGAQIDFGLMADAPATIAGLVVGVMAVKFAVLYGLARLFGLDRTSRWLFALGLCQVGEFAFVLLSFGLQSQIYGQEIAGPLVAVVAMSMVLTPMVFVLLEKVVLPWATDDAADRPADEIHDAHSPVVIAGYGRFGQIVGRLLIANGIRPTVLDLDPAMIEVVGKLGMKAYYGDASRLDLLHSAGCAHAKLFVLAVDEPELSLRIAETVRKHFPHLVILARARDRVHYYKLYALGLRRIVRETFASSYEIGIEALRELGYRAHTAHRLARRWRAHDERSLDEVAAMWPGSDREVIFAAARQSLAEASRLMRAEAPTLDETTDPGWNNESRRAEEGEPAPPDAAT